jgi:hypothetical protein
MLEPNSAKNLVLLPARQKIRKIKIKKIAPKNKKKKKNNTTRTNL